LVDINNKEKNMEEKISKEETTSQPEQIKKEGPNMVAILSYIGILVLIPLLAVKDDEFVKYHAKQGLVLFIAEIATIFVSWIPILGWLIGFLAGIIWLALAIMGILNVVKGEKKQLPLIGKFADKFKI
jgi:uncharacterized membrane protein